MGGITGERSRRWLVRERTATAAIVVVVAVVSCGSGMRVPAMVGPCYVAAVMVPLWRTDVAERRLPNALVLPGFAFAAVGCAWDALAGGSALWIPLAGALLTGAFFLVLESGGAVGMGDVKLAALLALCLVPVVAGAAVDADVGFVVAARLAGFAAGAFLAAGVVGVAASAHPSAAGGRTVPFGPYLLASFWAVFAWH